MTASQVGGGSIGIEYIRDRVYGIEYINQKVWV